MKLSKMPRRFVAGQWEQEIRCSRGSDAAGDQMQQGFIPFAGARG